MNYRKKILRQLLLLFLLLGPTVLPAQVSLIERTYGTGTSFSYTEGSGSNRLLVLIIAAEFNNPDYVTNATFGDKTFTPLTSVTNGTTIINYSAAFYLKESDISTHSGNTITLTCSIGGSNIRSITGELMLLSGVLQSTPVSEISTASATSSSTIALGASISSDNQDMIIASVSSNRNNVSFTSSGTGFTEVADLTAGQHSYSVSYRAATSSPTTSDPGFTASMSSTRLTMIAFEVNSTFDPLPVELTSFSTFYTGEKLMAKWSLSSEHLNDYFTLEASADGKEWDHMADIPSLGNTLNGRDYVFSLFTDRPYRYLKLFQTDLDGTRRELALALIPLKGKSAPPFAHFENLSSECEAWTLEGKSLGTCNSCTPSDFIRRLFKEHKMVMLRVSDRGVMLFSGIIAMEGIQ
ncbi:MAG: hypothetical protein JNL88_02610 [Bacteroidia bacterium]|nr:hypothetical protein [Bacteroidia bacterium]